VRVRPSWRFADAARCPLAKPPLADAASARSIPFRESAQMNRPLVPEDLRRTAPRPSVHLFRARLTHGSPEAVARSMFGARDALTLILTRGATSPAMTTVPGWAAELATQAVSDLVMTIAPLSAGRPEPSSAWPFRPLHPSGMLVQPSLMLMLLILSVSCRPFVSHGLRGSTAQDEIQFSKPLR
jgi:hypothetical protein